jgi:hypothetical protein
MSKKKPQPKSDEPWSEVSAKLDVLIRLSALTVVKGMKTQKEQIAVLSDAGFGPKAIASVLGASENTVNVALHGIRKERAGKEGKEDTLAQGSEDARREEVEQNGKEKTSSTQS